MQHQRVWSCVALTSLGRSSRAMIIAKSFLTEAVEHPEEEYGRIDLIAPYQSILHLILGCIKFLIGYYKYQDIKYPINIINTRIHPNYFVISEAEILLTFLTVVFASLQDIMQPGDQTQLQHQRKSRMPPLQGFETRTYLFWFLSQNFEKKLDVPLNFIEISSLLHLSMSRRRNASAECFRLGGMETMWLVLSVVGG